MKHTAIILAMLATIPAAWSRTIRYSQKNSTK